MTAAPVAAAGAWAGGLLGTDSAEAAPSGFWDLNGNAATDASANYIGTTDNHGLSLRTNGIERMKINSDGPVGVSVSAPSAQFHVKGTVRTGIKVDFSGATVFPALNVNNTSTTTGSIGLLSTLSASAIGAYAIQATVPGQAQRGFSATGTGVFATGVESLVSGTGSVGVYGFAQHDDAGSYGVWGRAVGSGYAGVFTGNVSVSGTISKGGGSFRIDHPQDPANKYLSHSFVESPEMLNVYSGSVTLDAKGRGTVTLPGYFHALNKEPRVQLTGVGPAAVFVAEDVANAAFVVGGAAGQKVYWQVSGVRQDAWANAHRIPTEENKSAADRGRYLHPELYGQTVAKSVNRALAAG